MQNDASAVCDSVATAGTIKHETLPGQLTEPESQM